MKEHEEFFEKHLPAIKEVLIDAFIKYAYYKFPPEISDNIVISAKLSSFLSAAFALMSHAAAGKEDSSNNVKNFKKEILRLIKTISPITDVYEFYD